MSKKTICQFELRIFFVVLRAKFYRELSLFLKPLLIEYYKLVYSNYADPDKIIWIDPLQVNGWYVKEKYSEMSFEGIVCAADWQRHIVNTNDYLIASEKFKSLHEHFVEGKSWQETPTIKRLEEYDNLHLKLLKYNNIEGAIEAHYKYDLLFESIKKNGFSPPDRKKGVGAMYINIGPKGEVLWTDDGNHRFFMALLLEIEKIPVLVLRRHKKWQRIRDKVLSGSCPYLLKKYQNHPDIVGEIKQ